MLYSMGRAWEQAERESDIKVKILSAWHGASQHATSQVEVAALCWLRILLNADMRLIYALHTYYTR